MCGVSHLSHFVSDCEGSILGSEDLPKGPCTASLGTVQNSGGAQVYANTRRREAPRLFCMRNFYLTASFSAFAARNLAVRVAAI